MWLADYINVLWAIKQVYLVKWQVSVSNYCTDQSKSFSSLHFTSWWSKLWWNQITPLIFTCNCNTVTVQSVCLCISLSVLCTCLSVFNCVCPFSLSICVSQVTGLSVSPGKDQLVVFHTKDSRDLVVCLQGMVPANESRIGELVGTLLSHFKR